MPRDAWNPAQYEQFRDERARPFHDLLALVKPRPGMVTVDLGCGTGELTRALHHSLEAYQTAGIDNSRAMLEKCRDSVGPSNWFHHGDIGTWSADACYDLVFSNAALQWVDDHTGLFARLRDALAPGGQLAVQMPSNHDHPSHTVAAALAGEEPFRSALDGHVRRSPVQPPEWYAALLHRLGFVDQHVRLQVYAHLLPSRAGVVEWVRGTMLTDYQKRLSAPLFEDFLTAYRERLTPMLDDSEPYLYPFKRLLIWARFPEA